METHKPGIRWKRVILAGFLSEVTVVASLSAVIAVYFLVKGSAGLQEFSQVAGRYGAVPAATVATFLMAFLAVRKLEFNLISNALLVGVVATLLSVSMMFGARPEDRLIYVVSFVARILASCAAGFFVQRTKGVPVHDHAH